MLIVAAYLVMAGIATIALGLAYTARAVDGLLRQRVPRHNGRFGLWSKQLSVPRHWPRTAAGFAVGLIGFRQMFL